MRDKLGRFKKGYKTWNKNKKLSKKHRENLSISHLGNPGYWKDKKLSEKHKEKLSDSHKGQHNSPTTEFKKGHIPWMKGKHPTAWNKGKKLPQFSGENHPNWKGRIKDKHGYIFINKPEHPFCDNKGYIREHRLVVESQIGRYLTPKEVVHHRGKRDDNRPENLIAFINESVHQRFHKNPLNVKSSDIIFDGRTLIT